MRGAMNISEVIDTSAVNRLVSMTIRKVIVTIGMQRGWKSVEKSI